jgi:hypothetical protein
VAKKADTITCCTGVFPELVAKQHLHYKVTELEHELIYSAQLVKSCVRPMERGNSPVICYRMQNHVNLRS